MYAQSDRHTVTPRNSSRAPSHRIALLRPPPTEFRIVSMRLVIEPWPTWNSISDNKYARHPREPELPSLELLFRSAASRTLRWQAHCLDPGLVLYLAPGTLRRRCVQHHCNSMILASSPWLCLALAMHLASSRVKAALHLQFSDRQC